MGALADLRRDFVEMPLHGLGVAAWQNEGGTDTARGTDGAEYIGRLGALILRRTGPSSPPCPAPGEIGLLTNAGFILEPNLYWRIGRQGLADLRHTGGEVFLKSSSAHWFCAWWRGREVILTKFMARSIRPTLLSSMETSNSCQSQCRRSTNRQRTTPWIAGIGPLSTIAASAWRWALLRAGGLPGALRSIKPAGPSALKRRTQSRMT